MPEYFSHDIDARNDVKTSRLIQKHGYAGYGLYWAIIELMNQQTDCQLPYDLKWLAWELHASAKRLNQVLNDFGLFVFDEEKRFFWSESARKRIAKRYAAAPTGLMKRRGRPPKNPDLMQPSRTIAASVKVEDCVEAPETPQNCTNAVPVTNYSTQTENVVQNARETASVQNEPPVSNRNAFEEAETVPESDADFGCGVPNVDEQVLACWNEVFKGTDRVQRGLCLSSDASFRLHKTLEAGYDLDEIKRAIYAARKDDFKWYLPAVLKEDNVQRLLTKRIDKNGSSNNPNDDGIDYSFMDGKTYYDAKGNVCPTGGEFMSAEFWDDLNRAREAVPF